MFVKVVMRHLPARSRPGSRHRRRGALDGGLNAVVRHAAAQVPAIPSRICASVGFGFRSSSTLAVMICPFWQKPHCGTCSSIQACCTGCSVPSLASPSSVVISPFHGGRRRDARPGRRAVDDHCARPALAKSAAKPRTLQAEIIAQDIEQRSRRVDIHGVGSAVHLQCYVAHSVRLLPM